MDYYGGIEAGGTKFNCIIASSPDHILSEATFPTLTPEITLAEVVRFFKQAEVEHHVRLTAMGIACFGPVNLDHGDPLYGSITSTPKLQWQNTPFCASFN